MEGPAITAAVIVHDGRVLLVRRRVPEGALVWQFPAGKVEAGETSADAAIRETREEVGLVVSALTELGERLHPQTGRRISYIACRVVRGSASIVSEAEISGVAWCDRGDLARLVPSPLYDRVQTYLDETLHAPDAPPPVA